MFSELVLWGQYLVCWQSRSVIGELVLGVSVSEKAHVDVFSELALGVSV